MKPRFLSMVDDRSMAKGTSLWEDEEGRFMMTPKQVQQQGLTEAMRAGLEEQGQPMPEPPPLVRSPTGEAAEWDEEPNPALEASTVQSPLAAPIAAAPDSDAVIEIGVSGGQQADGWRWWVIDDAWIAFDNRPQIDTYWADFTSSSAPPELVQGRLPRTLLDFIHDGLGGKLTA